MVEKLQRRAAHSSVLLSLLLITSIQGVSGTREHARLLQDLLGDYNPMVRPVSEDGSPVTVSIRLTLHQIRELDEKNQHLMTNIWLRFFWKDEFLAWNVSDYKNISRLHIPSSRIWRPDIVLYNSVDEERTAADLFSNTNVELSPDGSVSWTTPAMLKSACKIDIDNYPFDIQRCPLKFGSWTYHGLEVNVTSFREGIFLDNLMSDGEWKVQDAPCVRNEVYYSCCKEPYPDVTCTLLMQRRPLFYIYNLVVPCLLLLFIGSLVFCLPPESGEKVSLAMTVLLAMTVFMLVVMENIPPTSEVVPLLEQFIGATIVLLTMSASTAIFTVNFFFRGYGRDRPRGLLRKIVFHFLARIVLLNNLVPPEAKVKKRRQSSKKENGCVRLLPCNSHGQVHDGSEQNVNDPEENSRVLLKVNVGDESKMAASGAPGTLDTILLRLESISQSLSRKEEGQVEEDLVRSEWRSVALVLDRIFLLCFLGLTSATILTIFSRIPISS